MLTRCWIAAQRRMAAQCRAGGWRNNMPVGAGARRVRTGVRAAPRGVVPMRSGYAPARLGDGSALHDRAAANWRRPDAADILRRALVLLADHELNASTFATRVAVSTGAPLAAGNVEWPRHIDWTAARAGVARRVGVGGWRESSRCGGDDTRLAFSGSSDRRLRAPSVPTGRSKGDRFVATISSARRIRGASRRR